MVIREGWIGGWREEKGENEKVHLLLQQTYKYVHICREQQQQQQQRVQKHRASERT